MPTMYFRFKLAELFQGQLSLPCPSSQSWLPWGGRISKENEPGCPRVKAGEAARAKRLCVCALESVTWRD